MEHEGSFWHNPIAAVNEINPDLTVLIGDFGMGSDAPIVLDYSRGTNAPTVIRLKWSPDGNHWVELAPDLATFIAFLKG